MTFRPDVTRGAATAAYQIDGADARDSVRDPGHPAAEGDWLDPRYAADHTHLTPEGYARFGAAVATAILTLEPTP